MQTACPMSRMVGRPMACNSCPVSHSQSHICCWSQMPCHCPAAHSARMHLLRRCTAAGLALAWQLLHALHHLRLWPVLPQKRVGVTLSQCNAGSAARATCPQPHHFAPQTVMPDQHPCPARCAPATVCNAGAGDPGSRPDPGEPAQAVDEPGPSARPRLSREALRLQPFAWDSCDPGLCHALVACRCRKLGHCACPRSLPAAPKVSSACLQSLSRRALAAGAQRCTRPTWRLSASGSCSEARAGAMPPSSTAAAQLAGSRPSRGHACLQVRTTVLCEESQASSPACWPRLEAMHRIGSVRVPSVHPDATMKAETSPLCRRAEPSRTIGAAGRQQR